MARPKGSPNVRLGEVQRIRQLFHQGIRLTDIARELGRGMTTVERAVRGLKRERPHPPRAERSATS